MISEWTGFSVAVPTPGPFLPPPASVRLPGTGRLSRRHWGAMWSVPGGLNVPLHKLRLICAVVALVLTRATLFVFLSKACWDPSEGSRLRLRAATATTHVVTTSAATTFIALIAAAALFTACANAGALSHATAAIVTTACVAAMYTAATLCTTATTAALVTDPTRPLCAYLLLSLLLFVAPILFMFPVVTFFVVPGLYMPVGWGFPQIFLRCIFSCFPGCSANSTSLPVVAAPVLSTSSTSMPVISAVSALTDPLVPNLIPGMSPVIDPTVPRTIPAGSPAACTSDAAATAAAATTLFFSSSHATAHVGPLSSLSCTAWHLCLSASVW